MATPHPYGFREVRVVGRVLVETTGGIAHIEALTLVDEKALALRLFEVLPHALLRLPIAVPLRGGQDEHRHLELFQEGIHISLEGTGALALEGAPDVALVREDHNPPRARGSHALRCSFGAKATVK